MSDYIIRNRFLSLSRVHSGWWGIGLNSGYEEHRPYLRIIGFRRFLTINLPKWIVQPHRRKVIAETWDAATVARMGRNWYWDETRREFGISLYEGRISIDYGVQPDCWPGDKRVSWSLPWTEWRCIENRWLDLHGEVFERVPNEAPYQEREAAKNRAPCMRFAFSDYDGERIEATVRMEDFEHAVGRGRWAWLDRVIPRRIGHRYDVEYSKECGRRKGSWKGGMLSCNGVAEPGELHEAAFRRHAAEEGFRDIQRIATDGVNGLDGSQR